MDMELKQRFLAAWKNYFGAAELPIAFYYSPEPLGEPTRAEAGPRCIVGQMGRVREGASLSLSEASLGCPGAKRYAGFRTELADTFAYFLSCGIPGKIEGERYKKSPELVNEWLAVTPHFEAPAPYLVMKRWDNLEEADRPEVVIFFATPDVLSGLFTLANYDRPDPYGVVAPMGSGCAATIQYPYLEIAAERPRAVLGMFDVSARPLTPPAALTLAMPLSRLAALVDDVDGSFLITRSWSHVRARINET